MKQRAQDLLHCVRNLMLQLLITVWIWTFGLVLLVLFWVVFKTKEFIKTRVLRMKP
jgi:hypothetical protein